jgi:hypothetical protein
MQPIGGVGMVRQKGHKMWQFQEDGNAYLVVMRQYGLGAAPTSSIFRRILRMLYNASEALLSK